MALIDKASLLMVPSVYEDGTLYNVLPSGNKAPDETGNHNGYDQTRADFTFSRGFNLTATRVNANGLIEKGRENLVTHSNNFSDSAWVKFHGSSVTSGQADKDGGTDAWKLDIVSSQSYSGLYQAITGSGVRTQSIYAKAGTLDHVGIVNMSGSGFAAWFDLTNGTIGTQGGSNIDAKIEAVGTDGWYRISITQSVAQNYFQIKPSDGETTPSGSDGYIYIQDAQLEYGLVSTPVIRTGATTATAGVLENTPRIDYSSGAGSLKLEPQRTNVVTNSEYVSSNDYVVANWTGTITTNTTETTSPEGVYNATKYVKSGASDRVYFHSSQPDGAYTGSVWLKAASGSENTTIEISVRRFGGGGGSTSKLVTITNEWQRFDVTATNLTGGTTTAMYVADFSMGGTATEFYSYGMQIEAGSYASSYIPTYGSAATRGADSCSVTGASDVIGQTEGTLYWELEKIVNGFDYYQVSDGGTNNWILVGIDSGNVLAYIKTGGAVQVSTGSPMSVGRHKIALAYAANDVVLYLDGVQVGSDTSVSIPATNEIALSQGNPAGAKSISTNTFQCALFNERLSNTELATLTTL